MEGFLFLLCLPFTIFENIIIMIYSFFSFLVKYLDDWEQESICVTSLIIYIIILVILLILNGVDILAYTIR